MRHQWSNKLQPVSCVCKHSSLRGSVCRVRVERVCKRVFIVCSTAGDQDVQCRWDGRACTWWTSNVILAMAASLPAADVTVCLSVQRRPITTHYSVSHCTHHWDRSLAFTHSIHTPAPVRLTAHIFCLLLQNESTNFYDFWHNSTPFYPLHVRWFTFKQNLERPTITKMGLSLYLDWLSDDPTGVFHTSAGVPVR